MNEFPDHGLDLLPTALAEATGYYFVQVNSNSTSELDPLQLVVREVDTRHLNPGKFCEPQPTLDLNLYNSEDQSLVKCLSGQELQKISSAFQRKDTLINDSSTNLVPEGLKATPTRKRGNKSKSEENKTEKTLKIENYVHIPDHIAPPRAVAVLPSALQMRRGCISPRKSLPQKIRFGPVQGVKTKIFHAEADELVMDFNLSNTPLFLVQKDDESVTYINVSDKDKSNWLSLLPLGDQNTANVWLYEEDNELYGITVKPVRTRTPLAIGYSKSYAEEHKFPSSCPVLDLSEALTVNSKQWWCFECRHVVSSAALLQRHINVFHKEVRAPKRKYACSCCARKFTRLFTLKRHVARFCMKADKQKRLLKSTEKLEPKKDYCVQNVDESKTPSDESFQNYTTGLDIPTNLFDTDRISNLDMSGSAKSETDFNPYKLENFDNNFGLNRSIKPESKVEEKQFEDEIVSCSHCGYFLPKSKKRRHMRDCLAQRFECECGEVFLKKEKLAEHIYSKHVKSPLKSKPKPVEQPKVLKKEKPYECDKCKSSFKRRGMLVNHLWRVHDSVSTSVPLERQVKHYPCSVCPKIYGAAAKRNVHMRNHHPGAKIRSAPVIEGGSRTCEPAACSACPRQYSTRAKLLQHLRAQHPHLIEATVSYSKATKETIEDTIVVHSTSDQHRSPQYY